MSKIYKLLEIQDKHIWNDFIIESDFEFYSFLHSWEWGEIQSKLGKDINRFGIYEQNTLIGVMLVLKVFAKRGNYYFIPHGPIIIGDFHEVFSEIFPKLLNQAKADSMDFIRLNSTVRNTQKNKDKFEELGFKHAPMHEHAEDTHLLDIDISEEELLGNMNSKDRYYINRAKKEGVQVRTSNDIDHIQILKDYHFKHAKRSDGKHNYSAFSEDFIDALYDRYGDSISTISTSHKGVVESIIMTIQFGNRCVYYIAASNIIHKKFSPNYLCQWSAIINAKNNGAKIYNFWGVSPDDNPEHPIAGVTKFKRKFAGYDYSLLHAQDFPITWKYYLNWMIETFRRKKRGYYYKKPE
ncbi:aminoacyltransferase [Candidatus Gracilibacteria bacterium]|nr:aminoacyltransferase [Candidatus Gracilibacteria bacterium]